MYNSTLSLTSALDGVGGQRYAPSDLPLKKNPVSIVEEAGYAPLPIWTDVENLATSVIRSPDHPARSESLCRLSYPGPHIARIDIFKDTNTHLAVKLQVTSYEQWIETKEIRIFPDIIS
jgi:hypothetical protein